MAANPKTLRIVDAHAVGRSTRALDVECIDAEPLAVGAGKYIILNTGAVQDGKAIKRAYSLLQVAPGRARLTVKRLGEGPGSNALHAAPIGTELSFSGPWGKLVPETGLEGRTLVVATDTGITTALGVAEGAGPIAEVLWLFSEGEDFLALEAVRARVESTGARFFSAKIAPVRDPSRLAQAWALVEGRVAEARAEIVLAAGDGAVIHPLKTRLGGVVRDVRVECFFHNPERKIA